MNPMSSGKTKIFAGVPLMVNVVPRYNVLEMAAVAKFVKVY